MSPGPIPRTLYIHLPWCVRKCPYCDFNSYEGNAIPEPRYVAALLRDLDDELARAEPATIHAIFFGGGTPSLFSGTAIARILEAVAHRVTLNSGCEITLEANPGAADSARFAAYRAGGVNRLSIGVQSFNDQCLRSLGRIHDGAAAVRAVEAARAAGFNNLNLDLMYGLPGQEPGAFAADLDTALALAPEHLSLYQLTLEEGTPFAHAPPRLPPEDRIEEMETLLRTRVLAEYDRYEISAYARPGYACRHNLNYWEFGDYFGIGAGAHGKISAAEGIWRHRKPGQPEAYMREAGLRAMRRVLSPEEARFEFMLNASRLTGGFDARRFPEHTGLPLAYLQEALAPALAAGLMWEQSGRIGTTALGLRFLNDLQALFLPEEPPSLATSR